MSHAALPILLERLHDRPWMRVLTVLAGVGLLSVLAHVSIRLPWTIVPITGQTFGVAFLALTCGRRYAVSMLVSYLLLGFAGAPVFAATVTSGSATFGYLIGMLIAAGVVGLLADLGWARTFPSALAAAYVGSAIIFVCGLIGLSYFVPREGLLAAGLYPFLLGDLLKNLAASGLALGLRRSVVAPPPTTPNQNQK